MYRVVSCNLLLLPCIYQSLNRAFIVVKAEPRIDVVVAHVREYADRFLESPLDLLAVLVSHMDTVNWTREDFVPKIDKELGFKDKDVILSRFVIILEYISKLIQYLHI